MNDTSDVDVLDVIVLTMVLSNDTTLHTFSIMKSALYNMKSISRHYNLNSLNKLMFYSSLTKGTYIHTSNACVFNDSYVVQILKNENFTSEN